jgi:hypothetical protein
VSTVLGHLPRFRQRLFGAGRRRSGIGAEMITAVGGQARVADTSIVAFEAARSISAGSGRP